MRLGVAAAGNAEENINLIDARFQAEALRAQRGIDCGVLDNSFYSTADKRGASRNANTAFMWQLTASDIQNITVGRGMATAYGYDMKSESDTSFTALAPSAGSKYVFIYLSWDLSNPAEANGTIDIHDNGSGEAWNPPYQDNLITNQNGKYQMPLYRLKINTSGQVEQISKWTELGVQTITGVNHAYYCENATAAKYAEGDPTKTIKEYHEEFDKRLTALGFRSESLSVAGLPAQKITRQGNYVICNITTDIEPSIDVLQKYFAEMGQAQEPLCTLPPQFRPAQHCTGIVGIFAKGDFGMGTGASVVSINTNGKVWISSEYVPGIGDSYNNEDGFALLFRASFEAPPIE